MNETIRRRLTVRVLLLDRTGRLLLIKGRLPSAPGGPGAWFTLGGGVEAGESLEETAIREVAEESGITGVELGPAVWRRDVVLDLGAAGLTLLEETYFVARCDGAEPSRAGWDASEQQFCDDIAWWRPEDLPSLAALQPERLIEFLPAVLAGDYPVEPIDIGVAPQKL